MKTRHLPRRSMLRGAAAAAVGLPMLEIMETKKAAAAEPRYFVIGYGGISVAEHTDVITPKTTGANWQVSRGMRPLFGNTLKDPLAMSFDYPSVQEDFSVVSGLKIPYKTGPGHRAGHPNQHTDTTSALLSGVPNTIGGTNFFTDSFETIRGPTSDFLVQQAIGEGRLHLRYRVQPVYYGEGAPLSSDRGQIGRLSVGVDGAGKLVSYEPVTSPRQAHRNLFQGFTPDATPTVDPAARAAWDLAQAKRQSVIDLVRRSADRLNARLGTIDRQRLERHFDEIRSLENRIAKLQPPAPPPTRKSGCTAMAEPTDPAVALPWSDETTRARIMTDLTYLAIACDRARSINLQFTMGSCYISARHITGYDPPYAKDVHQTGHTGDTTYQAMADIWAWHIKYLASLVHKLKTTPTATGNLLDQTAVVFVTEYGYLPKGQAPELPGELSSHSSRNMVALLAGRPGGLKPGRHFAMGNVVHPASVIVSAMRAVGVPKPLGQITTHIPELFG